MNNLSHLNEWFENERDFTNEEMIWITKLLSEDFPGRDVLKVQVENSKVIGRCNCGCLSIYIKVKEEISIYPFNNRVPVELEIIQFDQVPIMMLFHVVSGYIEELEVLRADSEPITRKIRIEEAKVIIRE